MESEIKGIEPAAKRLKIQFEKSDFDLITVSWLLSRVSLYTLIISLSNYLKLKL